MDLSILLHSPSSRFQMSSLILFQPVLVNTTAIPFLNKHYIEDHGHFVWLTSLILVNYLQQDNYQHTKPKGSGPVIAKNSIGFMRPFLWTTSYKSLNKTVCIEHIEDSTISKGTTLACMYTCNVHLRCCASAPTTTRANTRHTTPSLDDRILPVMATREIGTLKHGHRSCYGNSAFPCHINIHVHF